MSRLIVQHYRCPERYTDLVPEYEFLLSLKTGLFERYLQALSVSGDERLAVGKESATQLLARVEEAIQDLRYERYVGNSDNNILRSRIATVYYSFRPILPVAIRKYIQRAYLRGWKKLTIPQWPVDTTVDD